MLYFIFTIGGLHRRHLGGQNKRKFVHIVCTGGVGHGSQSMPGEIFD